MASSCFTMDDDAVGEAIHYYDEMLSNVSLWYNSFHAYVYHVLCVLGVLANACIVVVLCQPSMRRNPFNAFLIAIAVCDMLLMAAYLAYKQVEMCHPWFFSYGWTVFTLAYAIISVFLHSTSLWLTVNMAVLRYMVLRESSKSGATKLSNYRSALIAIICAVALSLIGAFPNMLRYQIKDAGMAPVPGRCFANNSEYSHYYKPGDQVHNYMLVQPDFWSCGLDKFSFWVAGLLLKTIPCLLLTVFMAMLVQMLIEARDRRSRLCNNSTTGSACGGSQAGSLGAGKSQAERTTTMLVIIVAVFLITELPQGILVIASGIQPSVRFAMPHLGNMVDLLSLINSSVNFILYATMSVMFRREFCLTFGFCYPTPIKNWNSKRKLKSNGASTRGFNSSAQTPTRRVPKTELMDMPDLTERLIENGETTTNSS